MAQSLSPLGLTTPVCRERLNNMPLGEDDPERIMMRLWEEANASDAAACQGLVPLILIAHRCNEDCKSEHSYRAIPRRDIELVAATVQYLGCHVGLNFLLKFIEEIGYDLRYNDKKAEERSAARKVKYPPKAPVAEENQPTML